MDHSASIVGTGERTWPARCGAVVVAGGESASILHADLDSFYAAVEQRDRPELRGKPVIVGGGIVLAASYEAKRRGVYTPMPEHRARRLCPDVVVVPPRFEAYTEASHRVFEIFHETTPVVEGMSIDEAFLDVRGLLRTAGSPFDIAARLRSRVAGEVGLPITVGVARTKFLAKVASGVAKPDGLLVVDPARETEFLHPLPVGKLWGVGPITERKLHERGLVTVADVAAVTEEHLVAMVGRAAGRHLHGLAHHRDPRRVDTGRRRGSIGSQQAMGRGPKSFETLEALLLGIVDRVTRRMRNADRVGRTVTVRLRFDDFQRATRARSLPHPTAATEPIAAVALGVFRDHRDLIERRGLTLVGLSVGNLRSGSEGVEQLVLPFGRKDTSGLDSTLDDLRRRFGQSVVTRASLVHQRSGFEVPKLPD
ncbi:MAG: DNA polymerase IV [Acidimicrobiaceae bacterium]|nr:DNA polymerase IV [Acidimicrobiaceae bacterium]